MRQVNRKWLTVEIILAILILIATLLTISIPYPEVLFLLFTAPAIFIAVGFFTYVIYFVVESFLCD